LALGTLAYALMPHSVAIGRASDLAQRDQSLLLTERQTPAKY
jgi:hypothetical protein